MSTNTSVDKYDYHLKDYRDVEIEYKELEDACYNVKKKIERYIRRKAFYEKENNSDKVERYNYKIERLLLLRDILDNTYDKLVVK